MLSGVFVHLRLRFDASQEIKRLSTELASARAEANTLRQSLDEERERSRRVQQDSRSPATATDLSRFQGEDEIDEMALGNLDAAE